MEHVWFSAALWLVLALVATMLSIWFRISTALSEIVVGTVAQLIIGALIGTEVLGAKSAWVGFLAGTGAIVLTFLAGAELDPGIFRTKWKEATVVGLVGFFSPFLGAAAVAHFVLKWSVPSSWLAGVALSTTSVAVVYAVMLEFGLNRTDFGKGILAACFVNDLGTVIALGLIFAPFTMRTFIFVGASVVVFAALPFVTPWFFEKYGGRVSELETKYILFLLFGMGGLAAWAGSEAVLPAYIIGMVLAGTVGKDHILVRRLRTLTFGLLTPFYFIRAGSLVSVPALIAMPFAFLALLAAKMVSKLFPLIPTVRAFNHVGRQALYYSLMMSTGLTFGTIAALFGLNHQIISSAQYSYLVATVIASAVVPTAIANAYFMPRHLLPRTEPAVQSTPALVEDAGPGGR
jgi:glutathione-regulated potassium-efflux system ancillary protein KefC